DFNIFLNVYKIISILSFSFFIINALTIFTLNMNIIFSIFFFFEKEKEKEKIDYLFLKKEPDEQRNEDNTFSTNAYISQVLHIPLYVLDKFYNNLNDLQEKIDNALTLM
ncbi:hypothetical protein PFLG_01740, partial [Plasmodium falciparum RAJ116]